MEIQQQEGTNKLGNRDKEGQESVIHHEIPEGKSPRSNSGEKTTQEGQLLHTESLHNPEAENAENQHFDSIADEIARENRKKQPNPST